MTKMLLNELAEIFDGPDNPFQNPETEVKLAKLAIKCDIDNGSFATGKTCLIDLDTFETIEFTM